MNKTYKIQFWGGPRDGQEAIIEEGKNPPSEWTFNDGERYVLDRRFAKVPSKPGWTSQTLTPFFRWSPRESNR